MAQWFRSHVMHSKKEPILTGKGVTDGPKFDIAVSPPPPARAAEAPLSQATAPRKQKETKIQETVAVPLKLTRPFPPPLCSTKRVLANKELEVYGYLHRCVAFPLNLQALPVIPPAPTSLLQTLLQHVFSVEDSQHRNLIEQQRAEAQKTITNMQLRLVALNHPHPYYEKDSFEYEGGYKIWMQNELSTVQEVNQMLSLHAGKCVVQICNLESIGDLDPRNTLHCVVEHGKQRTAGKMEVDPHEALSSWNEAVLLPIAVDSVKVTLVQKGKSVAEVSVPLSEFQSGLPSDAVWTLNCLHKHSAATSSEQASVRIRISYLPADLVLRLRSEFYEVVSVPDYCTLYQKAQRILDKYRQNCNNDSKYEWIVQSLQFLLEQYSIRYGVPSYHCHLIALFRLSKRTIVSPPFLCDLSAVLKNYNDSIRQSHAIPNKKEARLLHSSQALLSSALRASLLQHNDELNPSDFALAAQLYADLVTAAAPRPAALASVVKDILCETVSELFNADADTPQTCATLEAKIRSISAELDSRVSRFGLALPKDISYETIVYAHLYTLVVPALTELLDECPPVDPAVFVLQAAMRDFEATCRYVVPQFDSMRVDFSVQFESCLMFFINSTAKRLAAFAVQAVSNDTWVVHDTVGRYSASVAAVSAALGDALEMLSRVAGTDQAGVFVQFAVMVVQTGMVYVETVAKGCLQELRKKVLSIASLKESLSTTAPPPNLDLSAEFCVRLNSIAFAGQQIRAHHKALLQQLSLRPATPDIADAADSCSAVMDPTVEAIKIQVSHLLEAVVANMQPSFVSFVNELFPPKKWFKFKAEQLSADDDLLFSWKDPLLDYLDDQLKALVETLSFKVFVRLAELTAQGLVTVLTNLVAHIDGSRTKFHADLHGARMDALIVEIVSYFGESSSEGVVVPAHKMTAIMAPLRRMLSLTSSPTPVLVQMYNSLSLESEVEHAPTPREATPTAADEFPPLSEDQVSALQLFSILRARAKKGDSLAKSFVGREERHVELLSRAVPTHLFSGLTKGTAVLSHSVFEGVTDVMMKPMEGARDEGMSGFAKGLTHGVANLAAKPIGGALDAAAMALDGIRNTPASLGLVHKEDKKPDPTNVGTGLARGTKRLTMGVVSGITGIVTQPYRGAKHAGLSGFLKGIGKGVAGVVAQPVGGVLDFTSDTVKGIRNTPNAISHSLHERRERHSTSDADSVPSTPNAPAP